MITEDVAPCGCLIRRNTLGDITWVASVDRCDEANALYAVAEQRWRDEIHYYSINSEQEIYGEYYAHLLEVEEVTSRSTT